MYTTTKNVHGGLSIGMPRMGVCLVKRQSGTNVVKFRNIDRASREYGRVHRVYRHSLSEVKSLATTIKNHPGFEFMGQFII